jgi:hypothetical protein
MAIIMRVAIVMVNRLTFIRYSRSVPRHLGRPRGRMFGHCPQKFHNLYAINNWKTIFLDITRMTFPYLAMGYGWGPVLLSLHSSLSTTGP